MPQEEKSPYLQDIKKKFEKFGFRLTRPRRLIINNLVQIEKHLSAEEIFSALQKENLGIGLATVYRTLLILDEIRTLSKITLDDGKTRYRLLKKDETIEHQHFVICKSCNKTIRYSNFTQEEISLFKNIERDLEDKFNFNIERHVVEYYGLCSDCSRNGPAEGKSRKR